MCFVLKMRKADINNEIILMRRWVRQARVCVVNKFAREAKQLRMKRGTEEQRKKYERKADRLVNEIHILKTIKDDDITRFGIINKRSLDEVLKDPCVNESERIMAKVVNHKNLNKIILRFREKFPDYDRCVHLGKTTHNKRAKKVGKENDGYFKSDIDKNSFTSITPLKNNAFDETQSDENGYNSRKHSSYSKLRNRTKASVQKHEGNNSTVEVHLKETNKAQKVIHSGTIKQIKIAESSLNMGQDEKLEADKEIKVNLCTELENYSTKFDKEIDEFFVTEKDDNAYLSFAVQKINADKNEILSKDVDTKAQQFVRRHEQGHFGNKRKNMRLEDYASFQKKERKNNTVEKQWQKSQSSENLHPSWRAKKKQQEIMSQGFQGKKIVFTED